MSWDKRTICYTRPPREPCQAGSRENPMSTFNQSAIYPRVFPEIPREARPISHWPTLPPPPRERLPDAFSSRMRGPASPACSSKSSLSCSQPIRALRNSTSLWHDFQTPLQPPTVCKTPASKQTTICSARGGGGGHNKTTAERSKPSCLYYNGSRSQNGPVFSFLDLSNLAALPD